MFEGFEIYYYNGLFIDKEMYKKYNIQKIDSVGLYSVLNKYQMILELRNDISVPIKKDVFFDSIEREKDYFFIEKGNFLLIIPLKAYYGIKNYNGIITLYDNKNIRDAKLELVRKKGLSELFDDIGDKDNLVNRYNEQEKVKKICKFLDNYNNS